jgi:hypothetical protein
LKATPVTAWEKRYELQQMQGEILKNALFSGGSTR